MSLNFVLRSDDMVETLMSCSRSATPAKRHINIGTHNPGSDLRRRILVPSDQQCIKPLAGEFQLQPRENNPGVFKQKVYVEQQILNVTPPKEPRYLLENNNLPHLASGAVPGRSGRTTVEVSSLENKPPIIREQENYRGDLKRELKKKFNQEIESFSITQGSKNSERSIQAAKHADSSQGISQLLQKREEDLNKLYRLLQEEEQKRKNFIPNDGEYSFCSEEQQVLKNQAQNNGKDLKEILNITTEQDDLIQLESKVNELERKLELVCKENELLLNKITEITDEKNELNEKCKLLQNHLETDISSLIATLESDKKKLRDGKESCKNVTSGNQDAFREDFEKKLRLKDSDIECLKKRLEGLELKHKEQLLEVQNSCEQIYQLKIKREVEDLNFAHKREKKELEAVIEEVRHEKSCKESAEKAVLESMRLLELKFAAQKEQNDLMIEQMKSRCQSLEGENNNSTKSYLETIENLTTQIKSLEKKNAIDASEIEVLQEKIRAIKTELEKDQKENIDLSQRIIRMKEEHEKHFSDANLTISKMKEEKEFLEQSFTDQGNSIKRIRTEWEALRKDDREKGERRLKEKESEIQSLRQKIIDVSEMNEKALYEKDQCLESANKRYNELKRESEQAMENNRKKLENSQKSAFENFQEEHELKRVALIDQYEKQMLGLREISLERENRCREMSETNAFLIGENERLQNLLELKTRANNEWKQKYSQLQMETNILVETRAKENEELREDFMKEMEKWKQKYARLEEFSSQNVQELTTKSEKEHMDMISKYETQIRKERETSDLKQKTIIKLERQLEDQLEMSEGLKEEISNWKRKYEEIRGEICSEISDLNSKYECSKAAHKLEVEKMRRKIKELELLLEKNQSEKEFLLQQKEYEIDKQRKAINHQMAEYSEAVNILEEQISLRDRELKNLKAKLEINQLEREKERHDRESKHNEELNILRDELEDANSRFTLGEEEYSAKLNIEKAKYENKISQLKLKISELETINSTLTTDKAKIEAAIFEKNVEYDQFMQKMLSSETGKNEEMRIVKAELQRLRFDLETSLATSKQLQDEKKSLENKIELLQNEVNSKNEENINLYSLVEELKTKKEEESLQENYSKVYLATETIDTYESEIKVLNTKLAKLSKTNEELSRGLDKATVEKERLELELNIKNAQIQRNLEEISSIRSENREALLKSEMEIGLSSRKSQRLFRKSLNKRETQSVMSNTNSDVNFAEFTTIDQSFSTDVKENCD